jgi:hypothetical protein
MPELPEFVEVGSKSYEVVTLRRILRRDREWGWWVCHRSHRIYISRVIPPRRRHLSLAVAVDAARRLVAALAHAA